MLIALLRPVAHLYGQVHIDKNQRIYDRLLIEPSCWVSTIHIFIQRSYELRDLLVSPVC